MCHTRPKAAFLQKLCNVEHLYITLYSRDVSKYVIMVCYNSLLISIALKFKPGHGRRPPRTLLKYMCLPTRKSLTRKRIACEINKQSVVDNSNIIFHEQTKLWRGLWIVHLDDDPNDYSHHNPWAIRNRVKVRQKYLS